MKIKLLEQEVCRWLPDSGETVICALSGGRDSMCLLRLLTRWAERSKGCVIAAHFNHHLRAETAKQDEAFVREYCAQQGIALVCGEGDTRSFAAAEGLSAEEAGRRLRYAFLQTEAEHLGAAWICTAHHADDNAETMLLNLTRGTGLKGLAGIPRRRGNILRPLLSVTSRELAEFAAAEKIPYVEDETNADPAAADRNRVRLQVLPLLRELNPRAVEHMSETARQLRELDDKLDEQAACRVSGALVSAGRVALKIEALQKADVVLRPRMVLHLMEQLGTGRRDLGAAQLDGVLRLADSRDREACVYLPGGVRARKDGELLILEQLPAELPETELLPNAPVRWGDYTLLRLTQPKGQGLALHMEAGVRLTVGPCRPGDRLKLPGARGDRSVKRLWLDKTIPLAERSGLPALYVNGHLAAVWKLGTDEAFLPQGKETDCKETDCFINIIHNTEESRYEQ